MKLFVDLSSFALKSEHVRFLQDFIVWPNRPDQKAVYPALATLPRGNAGMKINETNDIDLRSFIHRCLKVLN